MARRDLQMPKQVGEFSLGFRAQLLVEEEVDLILLHLPERDVVHDRPDEDLFLEIASSIFEIDYIYASLLSFFFIVANLFVAFAVSTSPTAGKLYETIISIPK